jgi:IstB-like ATP binding protein
MDTNTDEQRRLVRLLDTLPERLALARSSRLPHHDFLEMLLTDEVARRDRQSAARRAKAAHLDPQMQLHAWDDSAAIIYDQQLWAELTSLRFLADAYNVLILQADRRTPPHRLNHHHQQPRATRDPDHDGRPTPCPVRHGPAAIRGLRTRHQRNAKLQLTVLLAPRAAVPGLYLHPDHRRRRRRPAMRTEFDV